MTFPQRLVLVLIALIGITLYVTGGNALRETSAKQAPAAPAVEKTVGHRYTIGICEGLGRNDDADSEFADAAVCGSRS